MNKVISFSLVVVILAFSEVVAQSASTNSGAGRLVEITNNDSGTPPKVVIGIAGTTQSPPPPPPESSAVLEDVIVALNNNTSPPISFYDPLVVGSAIIVGRSLQELSQGNPLFSPIEGLPDEFWRGKSCSDCHSWSQSNLCSQGKFYTRQAGEEFGFGQHPYGGTFRENVMHWAAAGCN